MAEEQNFSGIIFHNKVLFPINPSKMLIRELVSEGVYDFFPVYWLTDFLLWKLLFNDVFAFVFCK